MVKVKRLKIKKTSKFPKHCPFFDTNLIQEGSDFLSTALFGLFGFIQFRPHAVKMYFMPEGNLTHKVTGILMVMRERALAQQVKTLKIHTEWKCCPDTSSAARPPQEPVSGCAPGSALSDQSVEPLAMAKNVLPTLTWFRQLVFFCHLL